MTADTLFAAFQPQSGQVVDHPQGQLWQARFSPCGGYLLAAGYDGRVHRWDLSGNQLKVMAPFEAHGGWVQCLAFAGDSRHVFSADSWGRLACWPYAAETPQPAWIHTEALAGWIRGFSVSPDCRWVAAAGNDPAVRVWSAEDGRLDREFAGHDEDVFSVCFHPDGRSLVSGDWKGVIRHWDLTTGKLVRELNAEVFYKLNRIQDCGGVRVLCFDAEGKTLVSGGQKNPGGGFAVGTPSVLLFDWETGKPQQEMEVGVNDEGFVYDARFHASGFLMTVACAMPRKGQLQFWNPGESKPFFTDQKISNGRSLDLHPDGRRLAVLVSESVNGNGRRTKGGEYLDGQAKIHILQFPEQARG